MDLVNEHNPGETVQLEFYRNGQYLTVEILLGSE
jgi:S1-C subfamily serine protease